MAGTDRGKQRHWQGDAAWFIDFEQEDLDVGAVTKRARHRPPQEASGEEQRDKAEPGTSNVSPWVADFFLNQMEGIGSERPSVRRTATRSKADRGAGESRPENGGSSEAGAAKADDPAIAVIRDAGEAEDHPASALQATLLSSPSVIGRAKRLFGGYGARPYVVTTLLALGVVGSVMTWPAVRQHMTRHHEGRTESPRVGLGAQSPQDQFGSRAGWRDLPVEAAAVLPPDVIAPWQAPSAAVEAGKPELTKVASIISEHTSPSSTPVPAEALSPPVQTARIVRPLGQAIVLFAEDFTITARGGAEVHAVAADPSPVTGIGDGLPANGRGAPATRTSKIIPPSRGTSAAVREEREGAPFHDAPRADRRDDRRRQEVKPPAPRTAQVARPRGYALPAVLRPTSF